MIKNIINGICMALADSVPGVSGGTIAFIMGFYDKFIKSINDVAFGKSEERKEAFSYLFKLGIGWVVGMIMSMLVISSAFESHIYGISSLFIGFIIASIPLIIKEERNTLKGKYGGSIFIVIGILFVVGITLLNTGGSSTGIDLTNLSIPMVFYIFISGMIAISAMFLPGISGSTLLLVFGLYLPVVSGVKDLLHMNFSSFPALCIFGVGVIIGALTVVKLIKLCLEKFRTQTVFTILGLMIGSLYAIAMGPTTLKAPVAALSVSSFNFITCFIGVLIVVAIQLMGMYQSKQSNKDKKKYKEKGLV